MASTILQEFLVRIGFDVKDRDLGKALKKVSLGVAEVAGGAAAMATAVTAAVAVTANKFAELYYVSQKTGDTAGTLLKLGFAAKQVGKSYAEFQGQAVALAATLRSSPGWRGIIQNLVGATRGTGEMIERLAEWYQRQAALGPFQEAFARKMIESFGLDSEFIRQFSLNLDAAKKGAADYDRLMRQLGFDAQTAAKQGVETARQFNLLWAGIDVTWDRLITILLPMFQKGLIDLNKYITSPEGAGAIRNVFTDIEDVVAALARPDNWKKIEAGVSEVGEAAISLAHAANDIKGAFGWIAAHPQLLGIVGGAFAGGRLAGPGGAVLGGLGAAVGVTEPSQEKLRKYGGFIPGPVDLGEKLFHWLAGQTHSPNVEIHEARGVWTRLRDWLMGVGMIAPPVRIVRNEAQDQQSWIARLFGGGAATRAAGAGTGGKFLGAMNPPGGGAYSTATAAQAQELYNYARSRGLDDAHARAMISNALAESGLDPRRIGDQGTSFGLFQEHADRWANMRRSLGDRVNDPYSQIFYAIKEMWQRHPEWFRPGNAADLTAQFEHGFEAPRIETGRLAALEQLNRMLTTTVAAARSPNLVAGGALQQHNHFAGTTITISGAGDPMAVGQHVFSAQKRLAADLVRDLSAAAS